MKKIFVMIFVLGMVVNLSATTVELAKKIDLVNKLMKVTKVEEQMMNSLKMVKNMQKNMINQLTGNIKDRESALKIQQKSFELVMKEFSWNKFQDDFAKIYAEVFSVKELEGLIAFYKSDLGQTVINKMPLIQQKLMPLIQKKVMQLIPKLKKAVEKMVAKEKAKAVARKQAATKQQVSVKTDKKSNPKPDQKTGATPKK
ncbi:MAG: DUF2059 domain-containing protein [Victivallaceae bacterium]|nr:DUF2059 domain-containing protein [Victivallaceae bacterium]